MDPQNPTPAPAAPPVENPPAPPVAPPANPAPPPAPPTEGTVSQAEFDRMKKEYEDYRTKVDPVLETIYTDPDTLKDITIKHRKRLGQPVPDNNPTPPAAPAGDPDLRNSQINTISSTFESKVGIDKLPVDKQQEVRGMVGAMIKEMLDPKGNKTITQVFEEVSLTKLPWYFEKAYDLVTKDSQFEAKLNEEKTKWESEQRGVMGGAPSTSIDLETVSLSQEERRVAQMQGLSDEEYLTQKKEILKRRES